MALADTAKLVVQLNLDDRLSSKMGGVNRSLSGLQRGLGQTGKGLGQVASGLGRIGLVAGTVAVGGFIAVAKAAGNFEAQLNTINTIVKLSDTDLKALGEGIRETFRETGQPLEDLTAAYYDLLSAGIKVEDAQSVLNTAVKLGIGGLATTAESVDLLTTAINAYGLNASGAAAASDIFAAAVRDGKVKVSEINASFADVAPLAATVGVKLEEIGAAYATLTARGVPATEVGTQFNRAIIELLKPGPELVGIMEDLGLSSFEASIKQKGLVETLQDVRDEAEKQGIPFQDLFGRLEAYKFALATTGPNQAKFNQELAAMGDAAGETNAQFAERQKGLNFQLAKLKALAQDAGITIGNALIPKLVPLVTRLNDFIQKNQGKIAEFGQKLADAFTKFATAAQKADFSGLIEGLKILGTVGKKVVDLFLSLPSGVQAAIVAGVAVNKLSGGLLGQGAGNIAGGLIKLVFERGASPANPLWVQSVGGGVGGPGVVGGGGLGGFLKGALGVSLFTGIALAVGDFLAQNVTRPADPTQFDFTGVAAASGRFPNGSQLGIPAANRFAERLSDELDLPLDSVKQGIVNAVNDQGLTFDQAVAQLRASVDEGTAATKANKPTPAQERLRDILPPWLRDVKPKPLSPNPPPPPGGNVPTPQEQIRDFLDKLPFGLGNVKVPKPLPDTALAPIRATADSTRKLPPILDRQERATQVLQQRMGELRAAQMTGNTQLGVIAAKPPGNVNVQVAVTTNLSVNNVLRKITSAWIASGKIGAMADLV